jgi:hypothetical protein
MVEVHIGFEELPLDVEAKDRAHDLILDYALLKGVRDCMLITHIFPPDFDAGVHHYLVRMALVLNGKEARYSQAYHVIKEEAVRLALRTIQLQVAREKFLLNWRNHEDALAA